MDFNFNQELVERERDQTFDANVVLSQQEGTEDTYNPVMFNVIPDEDGSMKIYKMTDDVSVREKFENVDDGGMIVDETVGFNEDWFGELGEGVGEAAAACGG